MAGQARVDGVWSRSEESAGANRRADVSKQKPNAEPPEGSTGAAPKSRMEPAQQSMHVGEDDKQDPDHGPDDKPVEREDLEIVPLPHFG